MFFLRCAFWLTIVYASMSWPIGTFDTKGAGASRVGDGLAARLVAFGQSQATGLAPSAVAGIADVCARHRAECVADAARLTSLAAAAAAPVDLAEDATATAEVPLPVPDPRRAGRDAKLHAAP